MIASETEDVEQRIEEPQVRDLTPEEDSDRNKRESNSTAEDKHGE